jgi:hypothetical protein
MLVTCDVRYRALETELIEKDVVHEARLQELYGEKVLSNSNEPSFVSASLIECSIVYDTVESVLYCFFCLYNVDIHDTYTALKSVFIQLHIFIDGSKHYCLFFAFRELWCYIRTCRSSLL